MEAQGQVAVIGTGAMGAGIAQVAATAGHVVHLVDAVEGAAERARAGIASRLDDRVSRGRMEAREAAAVLSRLAVASGVSALPDCAVVIEAVREDLEVKRDLFAQLAALQPPTAVLASNTSSIDVDAIADAVAEPERVIGLHFFNPAPAMALVEVVAGRRSAEAYLAFGCDLVRGWGKTPVRCASTPGFIVNRVARPFYGEAQRLLADEVADAATIDAALREAGFRLGPLELTDLIGQDVNLAVGTSVWEQTDRDPRYAPTAGQQQLVAEGRLGRKSGQGIYSYADDGTLVSAGPDERLLAQLVGGALETDPVARTLAMLVNEAVDLVHRGEAGADDVDLAMRLGAGYPRGIVEWGREIGFDVVDAQIRALDHVFPGGRYRPSPGLTA
ncbi:MAG: 3-hydroxyacyl-CoA dehydrogenase NAD-binding domain-containing protein [Actinomycetota bacterium]|nr:3-hydroxyacyl-CoA dehydrogenase NAD-binding domain-containing protein [Actinomycetota bacterium]